MQWLDEGKELVVQAGLQGGQIEIMLMSLEADLYQLKTEFSKTRYIQEANLHQTSAILSPIYHAYALFNISTLDIVAGASTDSVVRNLEAGPSSEMRSTHVVSFFVTATMQICGFARATQGGPESSIGGFLNLLPHVTAMMS
jgi:hypothetical protein